MLIPIIPKDPDTDGFSCRDGEIEYSSAGAYVGEGSGIGSKDEYDAEAASEAYGIRFSLSPEGAYPSFNVRIPLGDGEAQHASLMLNGEISRADAGVVERLTSAILEKTAVEFARIVTENRRLGLHLLPFRVYCRVMSSSGAVGYPTPQAVMLPSETPPHPEITASAVTSSLMSLSLRIPVRPVRLSVIIPSGTDGSHAVRTFVSYPIFIPAKDEIGGSLGSVSSASGGNALGIRFSFLSLGNMKSSVAAPEKYYRHYGNTQTGYRLSSKADTVTDYSVYAAAGGAVAPFAVASLAADGTSSDPFDWIADWERFGNGCLPLSLPYRFRTKDDNSTDSDQESGQESGLSPGVQSIPPTMDAGLTAVIKEATGWSHFLLTRPMTFSSAEKSRRNAVHRSVKVLRVLGLSNADCVAVLLGSDDGLRFEPLRMFDPRVSFRLLSPPRLFYRLLLVSEEPFGALALEATMMTSHKS